MKRLVEKVRQIIADRNLTRNVRRKNRKIEMIKRQDLSEEVREALINRIERRFERDADNFIEGY